MLPSAPSWASSRGCPSDPSNGGCYDLRRQTTSRHPRYWLRREYWRLAPLRVAQTTHQTRKRMTDEQNQTCFTWAQRSAELLRLRHGHDTVHPAAPPGHAPRGCDYRAGRSSRIPVHRAQLPGPGSCLLRVATSFRDAATYGDLVAAILAMIAALSLSIRAIWAISIVWVFNVWGAV